MLRCLLGIIFLFLLQDRVLATSHKRPSASVTEEELKIALPDEFNILGPQAFGALFQILQSKKNRIAGADSFMICNGRLSLTAGTAVTTSDVTAATKVYFVPYDGNMIGLYSNAAWAVSSFGQASVSVPATTTTPFDIFAYYNSGTVSLETVNWTNDTTRATALTTQNGVQSKNGDTTRRYLGTARTTSVSGQTEDSTSKRFLWNACNRLPRKLTAKSTTDTWNYTTATWRAANNTTTSGLTRVEFVLGQSLEPVRLQAFVPQITNASDVTGAIGIGINSTSANSAELYGGHFSSKYNVHMAFYQGYPAVGYSYGQWLEVSTASGTTSFYTYDSTYRQGGLLGEIFQ